MLYTRNSFISYLTNKCDCDTITLRDGRGLIIKNGLTAKSQMFITRNIDYEEIELHCRKLYVGLPGNSDLEIVE